MTISIRRPKDLFGRPRKFAGKSTDPALKLGTFFFLMLIAYYLPTVLGEEVPTVTVFWAVILCWCVVFIRATAWVISVALWLPLGWLYLLGYAVDINGQADIVNLRNVLSSFVFTVAGLGIVLGSIRHTKWNWDRLHAFIHRFGAIGIALWSVATINQFQAEALIDTRDVTGANYLTTSDLVAMFALASIGRVRIGWVDYSIITLSCLVVLIMLGSRAAIAVFVLIALMAMIRTFKVRYLFLMSILSGFPFIYWLAEFVDLESPAFFRLYTLVNFSGEDRSLIYRDMLHEQFWYTLDKSPLCFLIACQPMIGDYIHNFLSVIQYFGIAGIAMLLAGCAILASSYRDIFRSRYIYLLGYCLIGGIFFRSWLSVVFVPVVFLLLYFMCAKYLRENSDNFIPV